MAGGRPTEWTPEVEAVALDYIKNYHQYEGHAFPSVVGLCQVINRSRSTVYKWAADEIGQFSDILAAINEAQELVILNRSITNDFNATISKLVLGKHGYHDKADTTVSGADGGPVKVQRIERIIVDPANPDS